MHGEDEELLASNAEKFKTKNSKQEYQIIASENEYVSAAQEANLNQDQLDSSDFANIDITTMHANQPDPLRGGNNANIITLSKPLPKWLVESPK